ncbi:TIR domain-containing protein [Amycolatopsis acidicola]|uniref:TIR domain-containing protein n=1 Tax=Amycolatopsis acidicola TaxID=2596893 RepID=A0A5N0UP58_9PSEU|nr:TIR domain-containing protein [Amycolatopsis acidicola]KAA9152306.1 TIR domain-containing protein [Amycolatopsis acidicola]
MKTTATRYDAFISYSHALDGVLAPALQTGLQRFAKPWYRARALRIFRDNTDLAAGPGLWSAIERALEQSSWLILLASPVAARSPWVDREVAWWRENRPDSRILVVLTEGEFAWDGEDAALPPSLRGAFEEEPRWVDLRWLHDADQVDQSNPRLRECVADIAAAVREIPKDHLVGRHIQEHRRTMRLARTAVGALVLLLVAALAASVVAFQQRDHAIQAQQRTLAAQRSVVARTMLAQADQIRDTDPRTAEQLGVAATRLSPGAASESSLVETLSGSPYRGTLTGHTYQVDAVAYSPDGRLLATAGWEGTVLLWAVDSGGARRVGDPLTGHTNSITSLAFSPDSRTLVTGSADQTARLWNVSDPAHATALGSPLTGYGAGGVASVTFSHDGRLLATPGAIQVPGSTPNLLWDVADPAHPRPVPFPDSPYGNIDRVAFTPDGRTLASQVSGNVFYLWDIGDLAHIRQAGFRITGPDSPTGAVLLTPDGRTMITGGSSDRSTQLWDLSDPQHVRPLGSPFGTESAAGSALALSPDGRTLATTDTDNNVLLWDVHDPAAVRLRERLAGHTAWVQTVAFSPDGKQLASAGEDATTMLWDVSDEDQPAPLTTIAPAGPDERAGSTSFSATGLLALAVGSNTVELWDVRDRPRRTASVTQQGVSVSPALSPDGRTLVTFDSSAVDDSGLLLWDVSDPARPRQLTGPLDLGRNETGWSRHAATVAFSPDGRTLAVGDPVVSLWSLEDRARPRRLGALFTTSTLATTLAFSPDGKSLAVGSGPSIILADVSDPTAPRARADPFGSNTGYVWEVGFSPDGHTLGAVSQGFTVLWDISDPGEPVRFGAPITSAPVTRGAFSPDWRTVAVQDSDGSAVLWDITEPAQPRRIGRPLPGASGVLSFSPDSRTLATTTSGGAVTLWDLDPLESLRHNAVSVACGRSGALNEDQWAFYAPGVPYENTCT